MTASTDTRRELRILLVDDEADVRFLTRLEIEAANHGLVVAGEADSAEDALRLWREHSPDVLVLDQRMPGMTGLELVDALRREMAEPHVVLFTAYADDAVYARAEELGVCEVLLKDRYREVPAAVWRCAA